jgi:ABC-type multidrug transport system fused ATPase/permease subunit
MVKGQIDNDKFLDKINYFALYLSIILLVNTYIYMASWVYTGERLTRQIRERYLRAILRQNIEYFNNLGAGKVTTRITSDTHLIQDGISEKAPMCISVCIKKNVLNICRPVK